MKLRWTIASLGALGVAAVVWAQAGAKLSISVNGKSVPGKTLVSGGQTYIPLGALKAAGATAVAKNGVLAITFAPRGGANQVAALEGGINDWLFNGIWRFRVTSLAPTSDGRPGWKVGVELRNGTKLDNVALAGSGFDSLSLVMADANAVSAYNISDLRDRGVGQGASIVLDLIFYDDEGQGRKPEKLILRLQPDQPTKSFLKAQGAAYTVADPSFRVRLTG